MARIIVDAFGGDNAPLCNIQGAIDAVKKYGCSVSLVGDTQKIQNVAKNNKLSLDDIEIIEASDIIDMHDDPTSILKEHKECSMAVGLKALTESRGDAFVSAGSTGALTVGATFITKRIKGIKRPAIATVLPVPNGRFLLCDSGANVECRPEMLYSFGLMGSKYMELVSGIKNPRVGLLNVGAEETKGDPLRKETYALLSDSPLNFVGNIEARDVASGMCDVLVADGFSGNIVLKEFEGVAMSLLKLLKGMFMKNLKTKLAALLMKKDITGLKTLFDPSEVGGAILLGVSSPVIKAHGSSDAKAIKNAIRQANICAESGIVDAIRDAMAQQ